MDPIYVFGHRNPDTDSVVSAIAYAALNNALGENEYIAARLGHLNDETSYLLEHFGFDPPMYLTTVRTQVKDINFDRPPLLGRGVSVSHAWSVLHEDNNVACLPVINDQGGLYGMLTAGSIAEHDMESIHRPQVTDVPVFNLLSAIEGRILNDDEDVFAHLSGEVVIALPSAGPCLKGVKPGSIIICGQQDDVIDEAIRLGASCVIICQGDVADKYRGLSSPTCLIATPCDPYRAVRMLYQAIPIERIAQSKDLVYFHLDDYIDDVKDTVLQSRYRAYPVLDGHNRVVGTLGRFHLLRPRRKRVVLMDHNETRQSVLGLDQAEIIGIIDHHRLADVQTAGPVFMRNEPVGSTTTIVATMYQERGLMPSAPLAGLMAAAILSDTVMFKSPTCTQRDRIMAERMARIAGIDLDQLGRDIFSVGVSADKTPEEMLRTDFKDFQIAGHSLGIAQISCLDTEKILARLPELLPAMEKLRAEKHYDMVLLMLTDVLKFGTELIFCGDEDVIRMAFNVTPVDSCHVFLPKVLSRKKQIVPALALLWG
ncbi:MAG: putative manganese-dependent inorganic diphosphatase [Clostridiales bacterium]|nr:putative manganese-dependent inorganic diphosphatase [Clostridiales bacterium]